MSINNLFGVSALTGNNVLAKRSVFSGNTDAGVFADNGVRVMLGRLRDYQQSKGRLGYRECRLSNSDINFNGTAFVGTPASYGNNRVFANGTVGATLVVAAPGEQ